MLFKLVIGTIDNYIVLKKDKVEGALLLRHLVKESDVFITYEQHNQNDVVAVYWGCEG